jgi:hypothetical protein
VNLYQFVLNDPVNKTDSSGRRVEMDSDLARAILAFFGSGVLNEQDAGNGRVILGLPNEMYSTAKETLESRGLFTDGYYEALLLAMNRGDIVQYEYLTWEDRELTAREKETIRSIYGGRDGNGSTSAQAAAQVGSEVLDKSGATLQTGAGFYLITKGIALTAAPEPLVTKILGFTLIAVGLNQVLAGATDFADLGPQGQGIDPAVEMAGELGGPNARGAVVGFEAAIALLGPGGGKSLLPPPGPYLPSAAAKMAVRRGLRTAIPPMERVPLSLHYRKSAQDLFNKGTPLGLQQARYNIARAEWVEGNGPWPGDSFNEWLKLVGEKPIR